MRGPHSDGHAAAVQAAIEGGNEVHPWGDNQGVSMGLSTAQSQGDTGHSLLLGKDRAPPLQVGSLHTVRPALGNSKETWGAKSGKQPRWPLDEEAVVP